MIFPSHVFLFLIKLVSCTESGNLKDKEKEIREKLVAKLKAKAESSVSR